MCLTFLKKEIVFPGICNMSNKAMVQTCVCLQFFMAFLHSPAKTHMPPKMWPPPRPVGQPGDKWQGPHTKAHINKAQVKEVGLRFCWVLVGTSEQKVGLCGECWNICWLGLGHGPKGFSVVFMIGGIMWRGC